MSLWKTPKGFDSITQESRQISSPPCIMPVVCLGRNSFPIITTSIVTDEPLPADVSLPIVAGAISGQGRVICFSQLAFLEHRHLHRAGTATFLKNAIQWLSGQNVVGPILALGFNEVNDSGAVSNLEELGLVVEKKPCESAILSNYKVVLVHSDLDLSQNDLLQQLVGYAHNSGGGLGVFYRHSSGRELLPTHPGWRCREGPGESGQVLYIPRHTSSDVIPMPINELLWNFDLAFTGCVLDEWEDNDETVQVPSSYLFVQDCTLMYLIDSFRPLLRLVLYVEPALAYDRVMSLKYHLMGCGNRHRAPLSELRDLVSGYLEQSRNTEEGDWTEVRAALTILLNHLQAVLTPEQADPIPVISQGEGDHA